jgi:hypothetical protein
MGRARRDEADHQEREEKQEEQLRDTGGNARKTNKTKIPRNECEN